jgi:hypothetical protein
MPNAPAIKAGKSCQCIGKKRCATPNSVSVNMLPKSKERTIRKMRSMQVSYLTSPEAIHQGGHLAQQNGDIQLLRASWKTSAATHAMVCAFEMIHPPMVRPKEAFAISSEIGMGRLPRVRQLVETDRVIVDLEIAGDVDAIRARHTKAATHAGDFLSRRSAPRPRLGAVGHFFIGSFFAKAATSAPSHRSSHQAGSAHHQTSQGLAP